jgi:sulfite exporter TauE/SafE
MVESLLIVAGGLLGSGHCIGMCGGFVLTLGASAPHWRANLLRQSLYAAGRVATYILAGAVAGFTGWRLAREWPDLVNVQAILSMIAGLLLIAEGLFALGILRRPFASHAGCPGAGRLALLLRGKETAAVFVAGLANGLLPCGLVYAYLALAASSGDLFRGGAVMALFGAGTLPSMLLTGLGGSLLSLPWRRRLFRIAALCMLLTGVLALARGIGFLDLTAERSEPECPYCDHWQTRIQP